MFSITARVSLEWMINKYDNLIPIPGSRKIERPASNYAAGEIHLTDEELRIIDEKIASIPRSEYHV